MSMPTKTLTDAQIKTILSQLDTDLKSAREVGAKDAARKINTKIALLEGEQSHRRTRMFWGQA